jgi:RNA polymerase sigma-70 factor (ECF subfamily)
MQALASNVRLPHRHTVAWPGSARLNLWRDAHVAVIGYRRTGAAMAIFGRRTGLNEAEDPGDRRRIEADRDLMAAIASGDESAFGRLIAEQSPRLLRFAGTMLTAGTAEAEEIVQEAFLRLWQQAEDWQPNGRISTWLHQVTYRLCIDNLRRRRPSVPIELAGTEIEDEGPRPDSGLLRADDVRAVRAALARLPERQRTALVLFHFQEMGQADAAAVMGIGESAFESLLARARRHLREWLSADEKGDGGAE